jgi:hypothetical protein
MQVALDAEAAAMPARKAVGIASPNPTHYREIPTRVNYALTPLGCRVAETLVPLCRWGSKNMADVSRIFERDTPLGMAEARSSEDG